MDDINLTVIDTYQQKKCIFNWKFESLCHNFIKEAKNFNFGYKIQNNVIKLAPKYDFNE